MMLSKISQLYSPKRPLSLWGVLNGLLWVAGSSISFGIVTTAHVDVKIMSRLVAFAVIGLLIVGVAQLMRGSAHGATSKLGKKIDGFGKALGVLGWSLGVTSAVAFRFVGTEAPGWVLQVAVFVVGFGGLVALGISALPVRRDAGDEVE